VIHDLGRDARERVVRRWSTSARDKVSGRGYGGDIRSRGGRASVRGCAFGALRVGGGERRGEWCGSKGAEGALTTVSIFSPD
jgi:hypothetical protein